MNSSQEGAIGCFLLVLSVLVIVPSLLLYPSFSNSGLVGFSMLLFFAGLYLTISNWPKKNHSSEKDHAKKLNEELKELFDAFHDSGQEDDDELSEELLKDLKKDDGKGIEK